MLDIIKLRNNKFEITDIEWVNYRKKLYYAKYYLNIIFYIVPILLIFPLFYHKTVLLQILVIILLELIVYYQKQRVDKKLPVELYGFIVELFGMKLIDFKTLYWEKGEFTVYTEHNVRYNQAIGFRVIYHDDGLFVVEIIADISYPGSEIFKTYSMDSVAELVRVFEIIFSDKNLWFYVYEDGEEWSNEDHEEFNLLVSKSRINSSF